MDSQNKLAEFISLILTIPTVVFGAMVVALWGKTAFRLKIGRTKLNSTQWFVLGVTVGFLGSVIDNIYWGIAWGAEFLGHDSASFWFSNGVYSNIPFRQIAGTIAAYCHIKSAVTYRRTSEYKKPSPIKFATMTSLCLMACAIMLFYFAINYMVN